MVRHHNANAAHHNDGYLRLLDTGWHRDYAVLTFPPCDGEKLMAKKNRRNWNWTKPIREEIVEAAKELREREGKASGAKRKAIELKLELLEDCFKKLGNVKFP
jgi:hypothetical protein